LCVILELENGEGPLFRRLLLIVNPESGGADKTGFLSRLSEWGQRHGFAYAVMMTNGDNDESRLGRWCAHYQPEALVAVGGDGTINLAARAALAQNLPLGVVPFGSANGMARECRYHDDPQQALLEVVYGRVAPTDVLWINGRHLCLHMGDAGINAEIVNRFQREGLRGMWGYGRHLLWAIRRSRARRFYLRWDNGQFLRKRAYMLVIANATSYGTGALINPEGRIDDGCFEVCLIKRLSVVSFFKVLLARFFPWPTRPAHLEYIKTHAMNIRTRRTILLQLDGEVVGRYTEIDVRMAHQALALIRPPAEEK
jgi:diacylglycerol kinase family enzyme